MKISGLVGFPSLAEASTGEVPRDLSPAGWGWIVAEGREERRGTEVTSVILGRGNLMGKAQGKRECGYS